MSSKPAFLCTKQGSEWHCNEIIKPHEGHSVKNLSNEKAKIAEEARRGAIYILQDTLRKKKKLLMEQPKIVVRKAKVSEQKNSEQDEFWMKRHAVLTEDLVKKLLAELYQVRFKENTSTSKKYKKTYAYVYSDDETKTIYLCNMFWEAQKYLGKDSQPGTLIHEVSHFLGSKDLTYEENTIYVGCKGKMVRGTPRQGSTWKTGLQKAIQNANNISDEFELTLSHKGMYENGTYSCCGETARYSVCDRSVPEYFHTCDLDKIIEMETIQKGLHGRSEIDGPLRKHTIISQARPSVNPPESKTSNSFCCLL